VKSGKTDPVRYPSLVDPSLLYLLAKDLSDEGMEAVDVHELPPGQVLPGRIVIARDADYLNPQLFPFEMKVEVLVVRYQVGTRRKDLAAGILGVLAQMKDEGAIPNVVVLEGLAPRLAARQAA
jgi:hypothetical protein